MYKPTDRQIKLWTTGNTLPDSATRRLRKNWADAFQRKVLPVLYDVEPRFASLYSEDKGRPNWSVARMLGLMLLQELHNLDDQSAIDNLVFDIRWQHALGLTPEEAQLSRRSLVEFRRRLVRRDEEMALLREVFDLVVATAIKDLKLSTREQRSDSTHIVSNITTRGRVDLFKKTLRHFMRGLQQRWPERLAQLPAEAREWFEREPEGWFGHDTAPERKQRLDQLADWIGKVVEAFADDEEVSQDERYHHLLRLLHDHCEPLPEDAEGKSDGKNRGSDGGDDGDDDGGGNGGGSKPDAGTDRPRSHDAEARRKARNKRKQVRHKARKKPRNAGKSLHSPFDPDAGYGRKGGGYSAHVTETCNNPTTELITDYELTGAGENDKGKSTNILERLEARGLRPEVNYDDAGYTTGKAILEAEAMGTTLYSPAVRGRLPKDYIGREAFTFDDATGDILACPMGHTPKRHSETLLHGATGRRPHAYFDGATCRACSLEGRCPARGPNSKNPGAYHVEVSAELRARDERLAAQADTAWWKDYAIRAGVEATMSELKRAHGLGRLRVRRRPRVLLAVSTKLTACNVKRWLRASPEAARDRTSGPESHRYATRRALHAFLGPLTPHKRRYRLSRPSMAIDATRRAA